MYPYPLRRENPQLVRVFAAFQQVTKRLPEGLKGRMSINGGDIVARFRADTGQFDSAIKGIEAPFKEQPSILMPPGAR